MSRSDWLRLAKTLLIGAAGGTFFYYLRMPLAWMMGAMVICTLAALGGFKLLVPGRLRSVMITILGVLLGSTFTPEALEKAAEWPITIAGLALYLALVTSVLYLYFRRVMGYDAATAYFSATPGGLNEMVIVGRAMGGDDRTIALVHGARILLVVLTIPFWFRFVYGASSANVSLGQVAGQDGGWLGWYDLAILLGCAVVGLLVGWLLRLPAYRLVGPMLASAAVHLAGLTRSVPPVELVSIAQVVVGCSVGARFSGVAITRVLRTIGASVGSTTLMLGATVAFAVALWQMTGIDFRAIVLAFAPGGLAEMTLIALALGIETAFIATHHVIRIAMIVIAAPLVFRATRRRPPPAAPPPA
ncbi:MAG: AbrB family transcriptional regulator [Gammaproteobacteria bacterium]|nr:AbrB family transcriptional regulator [Gammaproteobacteria bacterium]